MVEVKFQFYLERNDNSQIAMYKLCNEPILYYHASREQNAVFIQVFSSENDKSWGTNDKMHKMKISIRVNIDNPISEGYVYEKELYGIYRTGYPLTFDFDYMLHLQIVKSRVYDLVFSIEEAEIPDNFKFTFTQKYSTEVNDIFNCLFKLYRDSEKRKYLPEDIFNFFEDHRHNISEIDISDFQVLIRHSNTSNTKIKYYFNFDSNENHQIYDFVTKDKLNDNLLPLIYVNKLDNLECNEEYSLSDKNYTKETKILVCDKSKFREVNENLDCSLSDENYNRETRKVNENLDNSKIRIYEATDAVAKLESIQFKSLKEIDPNLTFYDYVYKNENTLYEVLEYGQYANSYDIDQNGYFPIHPSNYWLEGYHSYISIPNGKNLFFSLDGVSCKKDKEMTSRVNIGDIMPRFPGIDCPKSPMFIVIKVKQISNCNDLFEIVREPPKIVHQTVEQFRNSYIVYHSIALRTSDINENCLITYAAEK